MDHISNDRRGETENRRDLSVASISSNAHVRALVHPSTWSALKIRLGPDS
jgi:hypothetical protein